MTRLVQYRLVNKQYVLFDADGGKEALEPFTDDYLIPSQYKKELFHPSSPKIKMQFEEDRAMQFLKEALKKRPQRYSTPPFKVQDVLQSDGRTMRFVLDMVTGDIESSWYLGESSVEEDKPGYRH